MCRSGAVVSESRVLHQGGRPPDFCTSPSCPPTPHCLSKVLTPLLHFSSSCPKNTPFRAPNLLSRAARGGRRPVGEPADDEGHTRWPRRKFAARPRRSCTPQAHRSLTPSTRSLCACAFAGRQHGGSLLKSSAGARTRCVAAWRPSWAAGAAAAGAAVLHRQQPHLAPPAGRRGRQQRQQEAEEGPRERVQAEAQFPGHVLAAVGAAAGGGNFWSKKFLPAITRRR